MAMEAYGDSLARGDRGRRTLRKRLGETNGREGKCHKGRGEGRQVCKIRKELRNSSRT